MLGPRSVSNEAHRHLKITNRLGLHLRAAAHFVKVANRFGCEVVVQHGATSVNGKSIMGLATLAAAQGSEISLLTRGDDCAAAMAALAALVEDGFGEE